MSRIGIIGAMHPECEYLREQIKEPRNSQYLDIQITHGQWSGHSVCLLEAGIGKVNATLATEWLIRDFKPDLIINTGSAGGIRSGCQVGDFVLADRVCHHDIDISPIGFAYGEFPRLPVYYAIESSLLDLLVQVVSTASEPHHLGTIATGESFIYQQPQVELIKQRFEGVLACDMEAAAVAQVCHMHQVEFLVIRNLSDVAGEQAPANFNRFIDQASQKSTALVLRLIAALNPER